MDTRTKTPAARKAKAISAEPFAVVSSLDMVALAVRPAARHAALKA